MRRTRRKEKKGFTLVELICVVALLAILAVLAVPAYNQVQEGARKQIANSNARTAYSIGKANEALISMGGTSVETEAQIEGGSVTKSGDVVTGGKWTGTINGKACEGEYTAETKTVSP